MTGLKEIQCLISLETLQAFSPKPAQATTCKLGSRPCFLRDTPLAPEVVSSRWLAISVVLASVLC